MPCVRIATVAGGSGRGGRVPFGTCQDVAGRGVGERTIRSYPRTKPRPDRRGARTVGVGALLSLVPAVVANNAALVFVLVVVVVAATGFRFAGLLAALTSEASFDFFLTQPYLNFAVDERNDIEVAVPLALIGLAVTELSLWGRRQQARASVRAGYLDGVVAAARLAASGGTASSEVVDLVGRQVERDLSRRRARTLPAHVDQRGAATRPGTPPGRRHARRSGRRDPRRCRAHERRRQHRAAGLVLTVGMPSRRGRDTSI